MPQEIVYTIVFRDGEPVEIFTHQSPGHRDAFQEGIDAAQDALASDVLLTCIDFPLCPATRRAMSADLIDEIEAFAVARLVEDEHDEPAYPGYAL